MNVVHDELNRVETEADETTQQRTLSNGSADLVQALLDQTGLAADIQRCLSVEQVRRYKPAPAPHRFAAAEMGVDVVGLALVAAHPWDCSGANAAGLMSGWGNRRGEPWPLVFT